MHGHRHVNYGILWNMESTNFKERHMTNRERIINTFLGKPADRAPFGIGLGFSPWGETHERWKAESGIKDLDLRKVHGFDEDFSVVWLENGPWPHFESLIIRDEGDTIVQKEWRGITMRNRKDGGSMPEFLDYPVKTEDDWKRYKEERLHPDFEGRLTRLSTIDELKTKDAPIQAGVFPWGMFGTPRDLLGAEELLVGFYTMPDVIHDMMESLTTLWLKIYERIQVKVQIDHIHIWEDMSGKQGSLISMAMVEEFMMPQYDRIAAFAKANNVPLISVDSDGMVDELLHVMPKHGVNVFFPFEVQAGNDVREYRKLYPELGIWGGLDKNALADDKPLSAIHTELDRATEMLAAGRFVPQLDHLVPPNVSWKKWCYYIDHLRKLIGA